MIAPATLARNAVVLCQPARGKSVGVLRAAAAKHLAEQLVPEPVIEDAELVISELLTNAMLHGRAKTLVLRLALPEPGVLRIEVDDPDREHWPRLMADSRTRPSGNGMRLIAALTSRWGVICTAVKTVYAEIATPTDAGGPQ